jgi:hypothetical protein
MFDRDTPFWRDKPTGGSRPEMVKVHDGSLVDGYK